MQRVILFALTALASVLGLDPDLHDPAAWFAAEAALAVVIAASVVHLRKAISVDGVAVIVLSIATGAGLSLLGFFGDLFTAGTTLVQALAFGAGAGWLASGGWDLFQAARGKAAPAA